MAEAELFEFVWSKQILEEVRRNLAESARNDPKDRHVIAAALGGEATLIVTTNLRDFAVETLPEDMTALSPDDFLLELFEYSPSAVEDAIRTQAGRLKKPPISPVELVQALREIAPRFAAALLALIQHSEREKQ